MRDILYIRVRWLGHFPSWNYLFIIPVDNVHGFKMALKCEGRTSESRRRLQLRRIFHRRDFAPMPFYQWRSGPADVACQAGLIDKETANGLDRAHAAMGRPIETQVAPAVADAIYPGAGQIVRYDQFNRTGGFNGMGGQGNPGRPGALCDRRRHRCPPDNRNFYTTHIGGEHFCAFRTAPSKSRLNFLALLRGNYQDYVLNDAAFTFPEDRLGFRREVGNSPDQFVQPIRRECLAGKPDLDFGRIKRVNHRECRDSAARRAYSANIVLVSTDAFRHRQIGPASQKLVLWPFRHGHLPRIQRIVAASPGHAIGKRQVPTPFTSRRKAFVSR
ncbi:hypothetical protein [Rhizobium sp. ZW T2_16]|uniref:hypothetical protein n=1 Tax=Rhizobium sp. ZW T2_16 TaxID=3378083 RepID=UPI003852070C